MMRRASRTRLKWAHTAQQYRKVAKETPETQMLSELVAASSGVSAAMRMPIEANRMTPLATVRAAQKYGASKVSYADAGRAVGAGGRFAPPLGAGLAG